MVAVKTYHNDNMSNKEVHFMDAAKAMKNLSEGKSALSDGEDCEQSYDVEDVRESTSDSTETQPMVSSEGTPTIAKYVTISPQEELTRNSSEPILSDWEKKCSKLKKICFIIYAVSCFIGLIIWFIVWINWMNESREDKLWLKKDIYNEESDTHSDRRRLAMVTRWGRRRPRVRKCSDYKFGCCHIYYGCDISEQDELVSDSMTLSPYSIVQHDENGTNCPRLFDLISEYNDHYPEEEEEHCADSEFGCCEVNYSCDIRRRFEYMNNVERTKELWLWDLEKNQTSKSLTLAKRDAIGSNCPRVGGIVSGYERNWPIEISGLWYLGIIASVGLMCCIKNVK